MIATPNMEKPEYCRVCHEWFKCKQYDGEILHTPNDCPLIDIVTCGECKWYGVDDGMPFCDWWLREIEPNVFCSYGERRAEQSQINTIENTNEIQSKKYGERANADQHTQSIKSALNIETCNLAYYGICTDGDCNNCPYEGIEIDEPKVGKWEDCKVVDIEDTTITEIQYAYCPICHKYHTTPYMYYFDYFNYCPNCGAKMERSE